MSFAPIPASDLLRQVRPLVSAAAQTARAALAHSLLHEGQGREISCRKGCAYCCHAKVLIDVFEGARIYLYLKKLGRWTPTMRARLAAADAQATAHTHAAFMRAKIPCTFLDKKGACAVYPVRPLGCVNTFAAGDPVLCAEVGGSAQMQVLVHDPDSPTQELTRLACVYDLDFWGELRWPAMTLPGAVLTAAARIEGQPLPEIRRVSIVDVGEAGDRLATVFDAVAVHR